VFGSHKSAYLVWNPNPKRHALWSGLPVPTNKQTNNVSHDMLNLRATARFCQVHFPSFPITSANNCNRNASGTPNPFNPPSPLTRRVTRCSPVFFPSVFLFHFFSCVLTPVALQTNADANTNTLPLLTIRSDQAWLAAHVRAGKLGPQHAAPGSLDNNNNQVHLSPSFFKNLLSTGTNGTANTAATSPPPLRPRTQATVCGAIFR
jgi:hypothetical protein